MTVTAASAILDVLSHGPLRRGELARASGYSESTVGFTLPSLVSSGLIWRDEASRYHLVLATSPETKRAAFKVADLLAQLDGAVTAIPSLRAAYLDEEALDRLRRLRAHCETIAGQAATP